MNTHKIKIESENIRLPFEIFSKVKGKEVEWIAFRDGFVLRPVSDPAEETQQYPKLSKLKRRQLIVGNPEDLLNIEVSEWNEPANL